MCIMCCHNQCQNNCSLCGILYKKNHTCNGHIGGIYKLVGPNFHFDWERMCLERKLNSVETRRSVRYTRSSDLYLSFRSVDGCTCFFRGDVGKIDLSCEDNLVCLNLLTILSDKGHISKVPLLQQRAKSCGNIIHFNSLCGVGGADTLCDT